MAEKLQLFLIVENGPRWKARRENARTCPTLQQKVAVAMAILTVSHMTETLATGRSQPASALHGIGDRLHEDAVDPARSCDIVGDHL